MKQKIEISKRSRARRMAALLLYTYLFLKRTSDLWPSPSAKANHLRGKHLAKHKKLSAPDYRPARAPRRGKASPRRASESRRT